MPETTATCVHCSTLIEQVGTLWVHKPDTNTYKVACPGMWGKAAKPVSDAK